MTDNVKHSTSYFHEVLAKAFEMFKNGYEPVMETPFQPRRQGSAFVVEYKLVREALEFIGENNVSHIDYRVAEEPQLTIQHKWEIDDEINFEADEQKKVAESEDCGKMIYTKEELDAMHWQEFKKLIDEAGIRGRRRQNLTRDYLKYQEEEK